MSCPSRFHAEKILKTPEPEAADSPGMRGSVFHLGAELFVNKTLIEKVLPWDWDVLETFLIKAYKDIYNNSDTATEAFKDCREMTWRWFKRTDLSGVKVLELENRREFELVTSIGVIPFVYIIDRLDELEPDVYRVVDYKSIRAYISPDDLRSKIQPRIYALATQIRFPNAKEIYVEFDMVRHDTANPGVKFTREDNAVTWYRLIEEAEKIIAMDDSDPVNHPLPERINNECMYCVRKSSCPTLLQHEAGGGILAKSGDDAARLKLDVQSRLKALKVLDEELNSILLAQADQTDVFEWKVDDIDVKIGARKNTRIDNARVMNILPPDIAARYTKIGVTDLKALIASGEVGEETAKALQDCMTQEYGDPSPKVTRKTVI